MSLEFRRKLRILQRGLNRRRLLATLGALVFTSRASQAQKKGGPPMPSKKDQGRVEPLFLSVEDARDVIAKYCMGKVDGPLTPAQRDLLLSRLLPQMWLAPSDAATEKLGTTRLGGAPDLPKGSLWPMRAADPDRSKAAAGGRFPNPWVVRQLAETVPFEFIGQIELPAASYFPKRAQGLPSTGRLHFFLDVALLMHDPAGGPHVCKVIHDTVSVDGLERLAIPAKFDEMEAWWRAPDPGQAKVREGTLSMLQKMLRDFEAKGQKMEAQGARDALKELAKPLAPPDPNQKKPFVYSARAKRIEPLLVLPGRTALEYVLDSELKALAGNDPGESHYVMLTSNDTGPFDTGSSKQYQRQEWALREARRQRFMGPPEPEQDDPRFDAVSKGELPAYPWDDAQLLDASRKAAAWQMLLQVSVADLSQEDGEGTVYFMIHKDDLTNQEFSRVTATYQQT